MTIANVKLELRKLCKSFASSVAVKDVSLSLRQGEFLSLLGPSGCGKSTTLAMIAGFETPDSGDIFVDCVRVNDLATRERGVGIVFQDYAVFGRLSVRENLAFGLAAKGVSKALQADAVGAMAAKLGLSNDLARRGDSLNMSEMQRVALGRAMITKPALLLLDEPMSNLDANLRQELRGELKEIQKSLDQTILYVTHDQVEAMAMSDRIAVMQAGQIVQVGQPLEIYSRPQSRFVAEFIGDPPINIIPCRTHDAVHGAVLQSAIHSRLLVDGARAQDCLLAIRPHHVQASLSPTARSAPSRVRLVESYGSEQVLHIDYGDELLRVAVRNGFVKVDDAVHIEFDLSHAYLIDPASGSIAPVTSAR